AYIVSGGIAGGCAVPGVMATRTLRSHRERMATLLTAPFMNCGAKLPVLAMLIGTFFAKYQAQFMLFTTILAWVVALLVAKFLRLTILKGESTPFVMELPPYRFPTFKGLLIHTWEKTWRYIRKAGTVILGVSILLWVMMTYPGLPESRTGEFERERQLIMASALPEIVQAVVTQGESQSEAPLSVEAEELKARLDSVTRQEAELALEYSVAGRIGKGLEAVSWLPGFDWRTNIALIGGFAAKEVIVSTMATAYSLGAIEAESSGSLSRTLAVDPHWTPLLSLGLIVFIMFYSPCMVTLSCIIKEAGSWRWGVFSVLFNTGFAFILATLVYRVGSLMM
ncbi:MAG: nucleoside recognition domain-containing protein, partial [Desulfobulbaceae bacterium]|nr:nucleoside recognition domain-containing protein [Desulfobulbaceae bacterium]